MTVRHVRVNPDRYLLLRSGMYQYHRRVPRQLAALDGRAPIIRLSLQTDDILTARRKRDALDRADGEYWAAMISGEGPPEEAQARYADAVRRVAALGFTYRTAVEIAELPLDEIVKRVSAIMNDKTPPATVRAAIGAIERPKLTFTEVLEVYFTKIAVVDLQAKSARQRQRWKGKHEWAVALFHEVVGPVGIDLVDRAMALTFRDHWLKRVVPANRDAETKAATASTANRALGILRKLYREYYAYLGNKDRPNPFDNLSFSEKGMKKTRPPFSEAWIVDRILAPGALAGMNEEERGLTLALVETGARPIELCNLSQGDIRLDTPIPHIIIQPCIDPENPHELKTVSSAREVPLVGVSLEVFRRFPRGFPRYYDNSSSFSAAANKYLRENGLLETEKHTLYSIRHAFEDRMKVAKVDNEVRILLMGHKLDRPKYGIGGGLNLWHRELNRMALPFDPSIV